MFDKLKFAEDRYEEINNKLMEPDVVNDQEQYKALMKEYKNLTPIVEKFREYKKANIQFFEKINKLLKSSKIQKEKK